MAAISADRSDPERELLDHVVNEVDRIRLSVAVIDLQRTNSRGVVDRRVLITPNGRSLFSRKRQELHVYLHVLSLIHI